MDLHPSHLDSHCHHRNATFRVCICRSCTWTPYQNIFGDLEVFHHHHWWMLSVRCMPIAGSLRALLCTCIAMRWKNISMFQWTACSRDKIFQSLFQSRNERSGSPKRDDTTIVYLRKRYFNCWFKIKNFQRRTLFNEILFSFSPNSFCLLSTSPSLLFLLLILSLYQNSRKLFDFKYHVM